MDRLRNLPRAVSVWVVDRGRQTVGLDVDRPELTDPSFEYTSPAMSPGKRLGLHVTDQELEVWRSRSKDGPYRERHDAQPNSPGDWERIEANAQRFHDDPEATRWPGPTFRSGRVINSRRWPRDVSGAPPRMSGPEYLRDAAFHAMVAQPANGEKVVRRVRDELLWHSQQPALNFNDHVRWPIERFGRGYHPAFQISAWLRKLAYAFDYSRIAVPDVWNDDDQARFLAWLESAAYWYLPQVDIRRRGMWDLDGSPTRRAEGWGGIHARPIWAGGPVTRKIQHQYNNHVNRYVVFITDVGILTGNKPLMSYGRRWIQEFLKICVYPEGGVSDFYRWDDTRMGHTQGWKYGTLMTGATMIIADHLARWGDRTGYDAATVQGTKDTAGSVVSDHVTRGGPKSLLSTARQVARFVDETSEPRRYACLTCNRHDRVIRSRDESLGIERVDDWFLLQGNVFYRDEYLSQIHARSLPGTPGLPERPQPSLGWIENGDAGTFPGVNFMFGQMAGEVWPYPSKRPRSTGL